MRILVVGGTGFLGGAIATAARNAGHDVTVLTRGSKPPAQGAGMIIADRMNLPPLPEFDAVLDTCAYAPAMVTALKSAIGGAHYVMVSSISVYDKLDQPDMDETTVASVANAGDLAMAAALDPAERSNAMAYGAAYGPLKRSCENAAGDAAIIRLGLIVGAGDYMDRFTWWVRRIDQGGPFTAPGPAHRPTQVIDVRDAADFALKLAVDRTSGIFNVTGPARPMQGIVDTIAQVTQSDVALRWTPLARFTDVGLRPWIELPLIVPDGSDKAHMMNVSIAKAQAAGLTFRPFHETVQNVLIWDRSRRDTQLTVGMAAADEATVTAP